MVQGYDHKRNIIIMCLPLIIVYYYCTALRLITSYNLVVTLEGKVITIMTPKIVYTRTIIQVDF